MSCFLCGNCCSSSPVTVNAEGEARIDCLKVKTLNYTFDYRENGDLLQLVNDVANKEETYKFHKFPRPGFFQVMCQRSYDRTEEDYNTWKLLYVVKRSRIPGFYAQLYLEPNRKQLVLVFKGTTHCCNWVTDCKSVLWLCKSGEISAAFTLGEEVRLLIEKLNYKVQLFITGHSLGGFLAQIVTYTIKNLCVKDRNAWKNRHSSSIHPYTVVFDSPPCFNWINKISQNSSASDISLDLPITNYLVTRNLVNAYEGLSLHVGLLLSRKIQSPRCCMLTCNLGYHKIKQFKDIDSWVTLSKFQDITRGESIPYNSKNIPINTFTSLEINSLHVLQKDPEIFADILTDRLEGYKITEDLKFIQLVPKVEKNGPHVEEARSFIPRARAFLSKYRDQLSQSILQKKMHKEMKSMWESAFGDINNDSKKSIKFCQSILTKVQDLNSGGQLFAESVRIADLIFFAQVLKNSAPNLCYIPYTKIKDYIKESGENELSSFLGTLVLILNESEKFETNINSYKGKVIILGGAPISPMPITDFYPSKLHDFDEASQSTLRKWKLNFLGNECTAEEVFEKSLNHEFSVFEVVSFACALKEEMKSKLDSGFYVDQDLKGSHRRFKNNQDLTKYILTEKKNVLISSKAGMGKSTCIKNLRAELQNKNNWVVALSFKAFTDTFVDLQSNVQGTCVETAKDAIDILKSVIFRLDENEPNKMLNKLQIELKTKIFNFKLYHLRKVIFLFDGFDEVCPNHRHFARKLIKLICYARVPVVVSCRPQEENEIKKIENILWETYQLQCFDKENCCLYLTKFWKLHSDQTDENTLSRKANEILEQLIDNAPSGREFTTPIPLHLRMLAEAYLTQKLTGNIFDGKHDIYKFYIEKTINKYLKERPSNSSISAEEVEQQIIKIHRDLAIFSLVSNTEKPSWLTIRDEPKINLCNIVGVAFIDALGNVEFLHQTFAEYFLADVLVFQIYNEERHFPQLDLLKDVLTKKENEIVRHFMELNLTKKFEHPQRFHLTLEENTKSLILFILIKERRLHIYQMLVALGVIFNLKKEAFLSPQNEILHKAVFLDSNWEKMYNLCNFLDYTRKKQCFPLTPLNLAIVLSTKEFVDELLIKEAEFVTLPQCNPTNSSECLSILHYATAKGANKFIKDRFDDIKSSHLNSRLEVQTFGELKDRIYYYNSSPLQIAVDTGNAEITDFLMGQEETDCTVCSSDLETLVHDAIRKQKLQVVEKLLKCERMLEIINQVDQWDKTCLWVAVEMQQKEAVALLLKCAQVDVNRTCHGKTLLELTVEKNDAEIAKMLLEKDIKTDKLFGELEISYLHLAVEKQSKELTRLFADSRYGFINLKDKNGDTPLHYAVRQNDANAPLYLFDCPGWHVSLSQTEKELMKQITEVLIEKGADLCAKDKKGRTPLHLACANCSCPEDVLKLLLSKGADALFLGDNFGRIPLHNAVVYINHTAVKLLVQSHSEKDSAPGPTITDEYLKEINQLIPFICDSTLKGIVSVLVENKANPGVRNIFGHTPMYYIDWELISYMFFNLFNVAQDYSHIKEAKADGTINTRDKAGMTPLHLACINCCSMQKLNSKNFYFLEPRGDSTVNSELVKHNLDIADLRRIFD